MGMVSWNVLRLGQLAQESRQGTLRNLKHRARGLATDLLVLCELTTRCLYPQPQNLTYRDKNVAQLCYGAVDGNNNEVVLDRYEPPSSEDYKKANFKGGNTFSELADRAIGKVSGGCSLDGYSGINVYVFHAPAIEDLARKCVAFAACSLDEAHGDDEPWILVGDLNIEPYALVDHYRSENLGINLRDLVKQPDQPTFLPRRGSAPKKYDYALANFPLTVTVMPGSERLHGSDHHPILVTAR